MTTQTPTCAGYAMYLELELSTMVTQVLIMPEGMSSSHNLTPMAIYRRRLSPAAPRKTWKHAPSHYKYLELRTSHPDVTEEAYANSLFSFTSSYFQNLADRGWKVRNSIITVEVTAEDLEDSRMGRTPYKALGRVWKARKALGFPKEFLAAPTEVPF